MRLAVNVGFLFAELPYPRALPGRPGGRVRRRRVRLARVSRPRTLPRAVTGGPAGRVALIGVAAAVRGSTATMGDANDPAASDRWRLRFEAAMRLADELGCPTLSVLAGSRVAGVSMVIQLNTFRDNLAWALPRAAAAGRTLTLELLNPDDAPRYLLTDPDRTRALLEAVGDPASAPPGSTPTSSGAWFRTSRRASASWPRWSPTWTLEMPRTATNPGRAQSNGPPSFAALADSGYDGTVGLR